MSELPHSDQPYAALIQQIAAAYQDGRAQASIAVNAHLVQTYGQIGQHIVEYEQAGKQRAEYGKGLLPQLSEGLDLPLKDPAGILELAKKGQQIEKPEDLIREPYVLEFLNIPAPYHLSETELESRIIEHLEHFLLELGKGFAFIGRQYRITLGNRHHYVDLVFYHRILKCFVLIDLKREEAGYQDIGQMNRYLGYMEQEENTEGDNPPIGMILARKKDDILIQYALHNVSSQLFVNKYQRYLPNQEELTRLIESHLMEK